MTVHIDDYAECFGQTDPALLDTLKANFHDAARVMSPTGLRDYLEGAKALCNLGRGHDAILSYLEEMPAVVQECGEDIISDCIEAALRLSSMTSGQVIALLFSSLPTAACRLGDPELLRGYLILIHQLSAKASRGLRPMLGNIDQLLSKLTLSGLKRWANFGADAYRRDLGNLVRYFSLESADSKKMLQQQRRGTLFVESQRKLNFYLRALWGRDFFLRPTAANHEGFQPYSEDQVLHLPDAVDELGGVSGMDLYRAQAAHLAAHHCYSSAAISDEGLSPAQKFFVGLIEDARVEYCATAHFPGLQKLWGSLLAVEHKTATVHATVERLEQIAACLNNIALRVGDDELDRLIACFHGEIEGRQDDNTISLDLGLRLFEVFTARKSVPSLRILESIRLPYRDDNRVVWAFEAFDRATNGLEYVPAWQRQSRKYVSAIEMANEVDCELAGDDAQEIWVCASEFMPYEDAGEATVSHNDVWGKEPVSAPFHYAEWDYKVQLYRPDWATVYERRPSKGNAERIEEILTAHKPVANKIRHIIDRLSPKGVQRERNLEDGDDIDINAAVDAMISIRMGKRPDTRITMRNVIKNRDLAVTVLLDLSESTNEMASGSDKTVLDLTREAAALVCTAIDGIGDPFAVHGFASEGRHDIRYYRFKDFSQKFNDEVKARLAGMNGVLSTRMGAAIRHAGHHLLGRPESRKLLLLVTDGEPADIDERDPQHLRHDAKKAVDELAAQGAVSYCLTLDPNADAYVKRIFGESHYTIVDHVDRLPEKLPTLFANLTN